MNAPFSMLRKLDRLILAANKIKSINKNAFVGLQSLTYLNMSENNITSIELDAFTKLAMLNQLVLSTNNLLCDCNLLWFYNWLQIHPNFYDFVNVSCAYPATLHGTSLRSLDPANFTCNETPTPRIIEEPESMLAIIGKNITLTCVATSSSSSEMIFKWKHDNFELKSDQIYTKSVKQMLTNNTISTSELTLFNVSHEHVGKYQCIAANSYGTTYSQKIKITVACKYKRKKRLIFVSQISWLSQSLLITHFVCPKLPRH